MEVINNNDYVLYRDMVGKVELILGDTVIANIDGAKVKDHVSNFKKWDIDKIHKVSKEQFIVAVDKILDEKYLLKKYPNLQKEDIEIVLTSGALIVQDLKGELFK